MKTDERNKFAIKSFLGEYLDLRKDTGHRGFYP